MKTYAAKITPGKTTKRIKRAIDINICSNHMKREPE